MANNNKALSNANRAKKDEFYTQLSDIENELRHYRKHFKRKAILCNYDDLYESNFFKYFAMNFNFFGLKKLMGNLNIHKINAKSGINIVINWY